MPCQSFLANGTETDLEKQLPLCNEKKRVSLLIPLVSWLLSYENRVKMDFATEEAAGMA